MKTSILRRFASSTLAAVVAMSVSAAVFADDPVDSGSTGSSATYTIKIMPGDTTDTSVNARFNAYQIFKGTVRDVANSDYDDEPDYKTPDGHDDTDPDYDFWHEMTDIEWGDGIANPEALLEALAGTNLDGVDGYGNNGSDFEKAIYEVYTAYISDKESSDDAVNAYASTKAARDFASVLAGTYELTSGTEIGNDWATTEVLQEISRLIAATDGILSGTPSASSDWKAVDEGDDHWEISVSAGYYLIVDTLSGGSLAKGDSTAPYFLDVAQNITVYVKSTSPVIDKRIVGVTDADKTTAQNTQSLNGETAAAGIGDTVTFELTGTLPENFKQFYTEGFYYEFQDTLSAGLTLDEDSIKVYYTLDNTAAAVSWTEIAEADTSYLTEYTDSDNQKGGGELKVTFNNLYAYLKAQINSDDDFAAQDWSKVSIRVEYKAVVNQYAQVGADGNTNKAKLEYSSDPNVNSSGTKNTTTEDESKVYTYEIDLIKVNGKTARPVDGAGFTVTRKGGTETAVFVDEGDGKYTFVAWIADGEIYEGLAEELAEAGIIGSDITDDDLTVEVVTADGGKLNLKGLDADTYEFAETTTPAGYDTMADFTVTLAAATEDLDDTEAEDIQYNGKLDGGDSATKVDNTRGDNASLLEVNNPAGIATVQAINDPASILPDTGGNGVYFYYIGGGILVAGAAAALALNKKKSRKTEEKA